MIRVRDIALMPKLVGSFSLVAILAATNVGGGVLGLGSLHSTVTTLTGSSMPALVGLQRIESDANASVRYTIDYLELQAAYGDPVKIASALTGEQSAGQDALSTYNQYRSLIQHTGGGSQVSDAINTWLGYDKLVVGLSSNPNARRKVTAWDMANLNIIPGNDGLITNLNYAANYENYILEPFVNTTLIPVMQKVIQQLNGKVTSDAKSADSSYNAAVLRLLLLGSVMLVLALLLGFLIARSISKPLKALQEAVNSVDRGDMASLARGIRALADGNLTMRVETPTAPPTHEGADEIGQTAASVRRIIEHLRETAGAYEIARRALCVLISHVVDSAGRVTSDAQQLAETSVQVGNVSHEVAQAANMVAAATSEQTGSTNEVLVQTQMLANVVERVAGGTLQQSAAISQAESAIGSLRTALQQSANQADSLTRAATHAASTAKDGGVAIGQTLESINGARAAVSNGAAQVEELGKRSSEVGQIVAVIDDIASQTNLLALNAAIEAARAGEHGKGFTVVAAEVRKLAERASNETKEITSRINGIQRQVAAVISAMKTGNAEVERSALLGAQAQQALQNILNVVQDTYAQVQSIAQVMGEMAGSVDAVSSAAGNVSTVAAQTAQAAEELKWGAARVAGAMQEIGRLHEQSAATTEEISASTEEQSAMSSEMVEHTKGLAELANQLQQAAMRFVLDKGDLAIEPNGGVQSQEGGGDLSARRLRRRPV